MMHSLKLVHAPHLGRNVKLGGRRRPKSKHVYAPRISNYLGKSRPPPPASTNYRAIHDPALAEMYLNDAEGDCVIAARYHRIGQLTALASGGVPFIATKTQINADYSRVGGYVVGDDSTDQGCDMVTNNNDAVGHGYADGSKDLGWLVVDATDRKLVEQVIYLFEGGVDLGIELPDAWINPFPSENGFVWDVAGAPDPDNGHCVQVIDYDTRGIIVATWGLWGWITWAAAAKYLAASAYGEAYLHLSPDSLSDAQDKAPNGVAWVDLISDFDIMGGNVPTPVQPAPLPPAPPGPVPAPVQGMPTLEQVEKWATSRIAAHGVMTPAQAQRSIKAGLAANYPKT